MQSVPHSAFIKIKLNMVKPTDAELQILHVLWELGPSTVRTVNDRLNTQREVGYTTTLKIMQIMQSEMQK